MSVNNFMDYGLGYYGKGCAGNNFSPNGKCFTPGGPGFTDFMPGNNIAYTPLSPMQKITSRQVLHARPNPRPPKPSPDPRLDCNDPDVAGVL